MVWRLAPFLGADGPSRADMAVASTEAPVCVRRALSDDACQVHGSRGAYGIAGRFANETVNVFALPRGIRYVKIRPTINAELGIQHAWIPVSHTHTMQHPYQVGLWFYYMRGCSDFTWNAGRTVLVRNRCELAVLLERRLAARAITWDQAVLRVVRRLMDGSSKLELRGSDYMRSFEGGHVASAFASVIGPPGEHWNESHVAAALDDCARGIFTLEDRRAKKVQKVVHPKPHTAPILPCTTYLNPELPAREGS